MFTLDGRMIGDAWYHNAGDEMHMYFLTMPEGDKFGLDIGHAVSRDLVNWEYLGFALTRGEPGSWDDKNLATGASSAATAGTGWPIPATRWTTPSSSSASA